MREYGSNINLPSLDNLFSSEQERQDAKLEKIQILPLTELHPFRNHPFQVRDDDEMDKMVDSVKEYGVMTPAIVRPRKDGGYEIVAGHRRCHASQRAGVETMPCIVRDMDDDTAIILMVDSNCQREHILPSEKAKAYQMKLEAVKRKAGRPSKINSGQVGQNFTQPFSVEKVADEAGESVKQVQRFIRLNKLTPELMKMVDDGKLKTTPAVELSYLTPEEQEDFLSYMESEGCTPSLSQAQKLKEASKESVLTPEKIQHIMAAKPPSVKPRDPQLMIPVAKVERYFPKGFTSDQMQQVSMSYGAVPFDLAAGTEQWWSIDSSDSAYWAVQENINAIRAAAGLSPLAMDGGLSAAADARCQSFVAGGAFDHSGMTTRSEICAAGPIGSASSVCSYWQNSPAHYANITNASFTSMGVGCWFCQTAEGQYTYWTVTFN